MRLVGARAAQRRVMVTPTGDFLPGVACISLPCVRLAGDLEARCLRRELRSVTVCALRAFVRESEKGRKMAYSRMAFVSRGPRAAALRAVPRRYAPLRGAYGAPGAPAAPNFPTLAQHGKSAEKWKIDKKNEKGRVG